MSSTLCRCHVRDAAAAGRDARRTCSSASPTRCDVSRDALTSGLVIAAGRRAASSRSASAESLHMFFRQALPMPEPQFEVVRRSRACSSDEWTSRGPSLGVFVEFDGKEKYLKYLQGRRGRRGRRTPGEAAGGGDLPRSRAGAASGSPGPTSTTRSGPVPRIRDDVRDRGSLRADPSICRASLHLSECCFAQQVHGSPVNRVKPSPRTPAPPPAPSGSGRRRCGRGWWRRGRR